MFWHCIGEEKSVLAFRECREKCFGIWGMAGKVFWCCGSGIVGVHHDGSGSDNVTKSDKKAAIKSELRFWT